MSSFYMRASVMFVVAWFVAIPPHSVLANPPDNTEKPSTLDEGLSDGAADQSPIKSIRAVRAAYRKGPTAGHPVEITGTLTLFDSDSHNCFVQDGDDSVYVGFPVDQWPTSPDFQIGSQVRVTGVLADFDNGVLASSFSTIGNCELPIPIDDQLDEMQLGDCWGRWIVHEGIVLDAVCLTDATYFGLVWNDIYFSTRIAQRIGVGRAQALIGCRVRISGVLACEKEQEKLERFIIYLTSQEQIEVLEQGPGWPKFESVSIAELQDNVGADVKVRAGISYIDRHRRLLVEQDRSSLTINFPLTDSFYLGEGIDAYGRWKSENEMDALLIVEKPKQALRSAVVMTATELLNKNCPLHRVVIEANVLEIESHGKIRELHMEDGGVKFKMRFEADDATFQKMRLNQAARVRGSGCAMLLRANTLDERFQVLISDVGLVSVEAWKEDLYRDRITTAISVVVLAGTILLAMIGILRFQVRSRTRELARETARLEASYDSVREGVFLIDETGVPSKCNQRFLELFGLRRPPKNFADFVRSAALKIDSPDEFERWCTKQEASINGAESRDFTTSHEPPRQYHIYTSSIELSPRRKNTRSARIWTFDDITERCALENQLREAQKMEAVGRLAGGVAHDFNNILATILINVELMQLDPSQAIGEQIDRLTMAEEAIQRATKLTRSLLEYSRHTTLEVTVLDVDSLVEETRDFIRPMIGADVEIRVRMGASNKYIKGDKSRLQQVLMNLCLNARDAIVGNGTIEIQTRLTSNEDEKYVEIVVSDDGCGIPSSQIERIFDPFFTTKETGQGTGLGLSLSYGIVSQHKGTISVDSIVGTGTTFVIRLPVVSNQAAGNLPDKSSIIATTVVASEGPPQGQGRRILLADDETALRDAVAWLLRHNGYTVDEAEDGVQVMELIAAGHAYALVLMDVTMPRLTGIDALIRLRESYPQLPVILISGRIEADQFKAVKYRPDAFLRKPVRNDLLLETVRKVIVDAEQINPPTVMEPA